MNIENIIEKFESFILMTNLVNPLERWKIKRGKNVHTNGLVVNEFIKLVKRRNGFRWRLRLKYNYFVPEFKTYIEILFKEEFVVISVYLDEKQKDTYRRFHNYFLENKNIVRDISVDKFTARFENHEEFDNFFEKYIIGEGVCCLY